MKEDKSATAPIEGFTFIEKNAQGYAEYRHEKTGIVFVRLPGGTFSMGGNKSEGPKVSHKDEHPRHEVPLDPFLIGKHEVSQGEWKRIMETNPSHFKGDDQRPVESVSWDECQGFCKRAQLSLPTEAQWEYACRAGTTTAFSFGDKVTTLQVNYEGSRQGTVPVDSLSPNGFGLHNMHGNVWEWCQDIYDLGFYDKPESKTKNPLCNSGSDYRVKRGGGWLYYSVYCRSANRDGGRPETSGYHIGFRATFAGLVQK